MVCPKCGAEDSRQFPMSRIIETWVCPRCAHLWEVVLDNSYVQILNGEEVQDGLKQAVKG